MAITIEFGSGPQGVSAYGSYLLTTLDDPVMTEAEWVASLAGGAHVHPFSEIVATPTTLAGYGITDAAPLVHTHTFTSLTGKPTTLAGYGITDAAPLVHTHTFASLTSKPTTLAGYGITDAAALVHTHSFTSILGTPTTLAGYGIVDAAPLVHTHTFASLTSKPTTLVGYGITDAAPLSHTHDWGDIITGTPTTLSEYGITDAEELANKVITITDASTNDEYPSATAVYDFVSEASLFCGMVIKPTITPDGAGGFSLTSGTFAFAADANGTSPTKKFTIAGASYSQALVTNNAINFVLVNRNGGGTDIPTITISTSNSTVNNQTIYPIFVITRTGTTLDIVDLDHEALGLPNKLALRIARTHRVEPETGGIIIGSSSTPSNRTVTVSAGRVWVSATPNTIAAFSSATQDLIPYTQIAGVWTASAAVAQYGNTQYNDPTTGPQTLTAGRYSVAFIYRAVASNQNRCYYLLGQGDYTLGQAQVAVPPANLPIQVINTLFVGRIIILKNAATATQVDSAFTTTFATAGVTDHEALSNLLGGGASDHNHLTTAELAIVQGTSGGFMYPTSIVGSLPSASTNERRAYYITDATTPVAGSAVSGSGLDKCLVCSNGTDWIVTATL